MMVKKFDEYVMIKGEKWWIICDQYGRYVGHADFGLTDEEYQKIIQSIKEESK